MFWKRRKLDDQAAALAEYRKYALQGLGYTQRSAADEIGESHVAVCKEMCGYHESRRIREKLTELIGLDHARLWGAIESDLNQGTRYRKDVIRRAGLTQRKIVRELGLNITQVSLAMNGRPDTDGTRKRIAELLGLPVEKLWSARTEFGEKQRRIIAGLAECARTYTAFEKAELDLYKRVSTRLWAMRAAGLNSRDMAERLEVHTGEIIDVLFEKEKAPWLRTGIARLLARDYRLLWGEREPEL